MSLWLGATTPCVRIVVTHSGGGTEGEGGAGEEREIVDKWTTDLVEEAIW